MSDEEPVIHSKTTTAFLDALIDAIREHERRSGSGSFRELLLRRLDWALNRPERTGLPLTQQHLGELQAIRNALEDGLEDRP